MDSAGEYRLKSVFSFHTLGIVDTGPPYIQLPSQYYDSSGHRSKGLCTVSFIVKAL